MQLNFKKSFQYNSIQYFQVFTYFFNNYFQMIYCLIISYCSIKSIQKINVIKALNVF